MNCGRSSSVEWKLPKLQRRVRFPSPAPFPPGRAPGGFVMPPRRARMRMRMRMRIGYDDADRLISYPDAHNLSVKQQPIRARRQGRNDAAGVKGADGQWQGQAGVLVGGGRAWQSYSQRPSPTGAKGTGGTGGPGCGAGGRRRGLAELFTATYPHWCEGHRRDRRARLRCPWAATGPGRASRRRAERSSRRGQLAGGPPPTGTTSSPARQHTTRQPVRAAARPRN